MHGNSGNHNSHVSTGPVHDPSGTGETDSRSGGFSYENRTRFSRTFWAAIPSRSEFVCVSGLVLVCRV